MNIIQELENEQLGNLDKNVPTFAPGDTVKVNVRVVEGERERLQAFEGVCIARKNAGLNSSFTVRKLSYGEGVERVFPLYSPNVDSIEVVRRGDVRRSKLYYLRGRTGKAARISEATDGFSAKVNADERAAAAEAKKAADEAKRAAAEAKKAEKAKPAKTTDAAPAEDKGEE